MKKRTLLCDAGKLAVLLHAKSLQTTSESVFETVLSMASVFFGTNRRKVRDDLYPSKPADGVTYNALLKGGREALSCAMPTQLPSETPRFLNRL